MIELQQFDGLTIDEIATRLESLGYTKFADKPPRAFAAGQVPGPQSIFLFRKPEGGPVVKFSTFAGLSETFAALCRAQDGNPFFPKIFADRNVGNGIHMTVMEELHSADELGKNRPGVARAFATLIDRGRTDHAEVYEVLLKDENAKPWLPDALKAIAAQLLKAFHDGAMLDYNARTKEIGPVAGPNAVLFRTVSQPGKPDLMEGAQPVFAAPFRPADEPTLAEARIRLICELAGVPFAAPGA